jgi:hypothetical protein
MSPETIACRVNPTVFAKKDILPFTDPLTITSSAAASPVSLPAALMTS